MTNKRQYTQLDKEALIICWARKNLLLHSGEGDLCGNGYKLLLAVRGSKELAKLSLSMAAVQTKDDVI